MYTTGLINSLKGDIKRLQHKLIGLTDKDLIARYQLEIQCIQEQIKMERDEYIEGLKEPTGDGLLDLFNTN